MEFCEGGRIDDLEYIEKSGICKSEVSIAFPYRSFTRYVSDFQPFRRSGSPRMYPSGSRNPCSEIRTRELKYAVDRSIFVSPGGSPGLY